VGNSNFSPPLDRFGGLRQSGGMKSRQPQTIEPSIKNEGTKPIPIQQETRTRTICGATKAVLLAFIEAMTNSLKYHVEVTIGEKTIIITRTNATERIVKQCSAFRIKLVKD
jgi:hypothetical protein